MNYEMIYIPIYIAGLFALMIVALLVVSIIILRDKLQGYLAGLFLLSTPFFIDHAAAQYADVPLAFFFLSVITLLTFAEQSSERTNSLYMLAGIMSGLAAWTKNEGLLFVIAVIFSQLVMAYMVGWKVRIKPIIYFIMGLVPVLLVLIYFKVHFAPVNDLVGSQNVSSFHKLTSPSRYYQVVRGFVLKGMNFGEWIGSPIILLITYALAFGAYRRREKSNVANLLVIGVTLLGYFFVYIVTPSDLTWHMDTSLNRLLLQLYPSMLFSYFMVVNSPANILQLEKKKEPVLQ